MKSLHYSLFVLLLLTDDHVYSSSADPQPKSISAILQSYADAYTTTSRPVEQYRTTPFLFNIEVKDPGYVYDYTTIKPQEQRRISLPSYTHVEIKGADSNAVQTNHGKYATDLSAEESNEDEDPKGPPDHVIPYSEHEDPKEPQTRPNYTSPGEWAKPPPEKNIPLDFVPTKLYAQVRGTHTVKHLPQEEAIKSAETDEEKENAARLKEVVKVSKANTIYTEEGYEDAAYDHAGQIRDADFHEGFARKLKEDVERKKVRGKDKRPKLKLKNKKSRKNKSREFDNFNDDYIDHLAEVFEEARTSQQTVRPESLKTLKSALNKSIINPKTIAEDGIHQLEKDLRREAYETERTSTEPYTPTTTTYRTPTTVPASQNNVEYETTTARYDVFTVRPRRPSTTAKPKTYFGKAKIPSRYFTVPKSNDNYNDYTNQPYSNQPKSLNNNNLFWQQVLNEQNQTPTVTYQPIYSESQTVNPVIANPLAVATVNGHGPYLIVVTASPTTFTPGSSESQGLETTVRYVSSPIENVTKPTLINSNAEYNPFLASADRKVEVASEQNVPQYGYTAENSNDDPRIYTEDDERIKEKKYTKYKPSPNHTKMMDYLKNEKSNYRNYYTVMQPPRVSNALVTYPDYSRGPYGNVLEQWSVTHESERPVESVYDVLGDVQPPRIKPAITQKTALPVTRLLPPAPLSNSEYASFHMRGRRSDPIPPSVMAIVPIIEAIHKHESQKKKTFPFLFRKKRSALGPSREWEIQQREQRLREAELGKLANAGSTRSEKKSSSIRYPSNFHRLLNEAPDVASKVVDKEIRQRFKNTPNESSKEASNEESSKEVFSETSKETSGEDSKEKIREKENTKEKASVEVDFPELDFSDLFEEDEPESTTKKPSIDTEKYPFYKNNKVLKNTALKYIVNPLEVPRKTLGGMEFYNSRNLECEEIDPNLEKIVPEEEELANKRGARRSKSRLHGLGDKLDCYKAKYFDENPLDNPLFFEKEIEVPSPPAELNPKTFASRILQLPAESDDYVIPRGPKTPEEFTSIKRPISSRNIPKQYISEPSINYNYNPRFKIPKRTQEHHQRYQNPSDFSFDESRKRSNKTRSRPHSKKSSLKVSPAYQRQVYEDVMGTIMNIENMYRLPVPKRGVASTYSKHHKRDPNKELEISGFDKTKKRRPTVIDGLVPPPHYLYNNVPYQSSKYVYSNTRNNRHYLNEDPTLKSRIYKRSLNADDINEDNSTSNGTNDNIKKKTEKTTFRIILTTPPALQISEKPKRKRKTVTIINDEPTTQKTIYTIKDRTRHSDRTEEVIGKYDKFVEKGNDTASVDLRRKEPRYNSASQRNSLPNDSDITTQSPVQLDSPKVTSQASVDPSYSGSTLIPVVVKPDDSFTTRIPQESKARYTKKKLDNSNDYEEKEEEFDNHEGINKNKRLENDTKPQKNQYLVHENIQEDPNEQKSGEIVTEYSSGPIDSQEHKELYEFLKGDPPGYAETFGKESTPDYEDSRSKESQRNEKTKEDTHPESEEDNHQVGEEEEDSKEKYVGESTSENAEEEPQENAHPSKDEEENSKANSHEDNEPFVRYSSRPYSPPENYEDERYSDLGPRVNKPSFYHPPFEVPEYEKYTLGKTVDRSDDDWGHSEETEDHEKYVFPWENDKEEEEKGDESQHYASLGRYEFPWERRERKERERKMKEKLRKKYEKNYYDSNEDDGTEATNTRPVYVSLEDEHSRGKKDVNKLEGSSERRPVTKFSSKYKSGTIKVPFGDDEISITTANNDEIKQSILNYLENIGSSSTPKIKTAKMLQKSILNNTYTVSTSTNEANNKVNNKSDLINIESTTLKPADNITTAKLLRTGRTTTAPTSITSSIPKYQSRIRSRKIKIKTNSTNTDDQIKSSEQTTSQQISSTTPPSRVIRRRGRTRDNSNFTSTNVTTTNSPVTFNSRRLRSRTSPTNLTPTVTSPTARAVQERRRRPFRTQSITETNKNSQKNDQSSSTTLSSVPTSTGRTIEHHSRVSKEEIITKTFYPDEDDSDEVDDTEENPSKHDKLKTASEKKHIKYLKIKRRSKPKNGSQDEHGTKKEKVEKVTITMEETPNHVYRTKEIDRDGVKGKFVTITANNNSTKPSERKDGTNEKDAEIEEMKRRMDAFNSFDSVIRDTEDLADDSSGIHGAENYVVGNLLQKLPLPTSRGSKAGTKEDLHLSDRRTDEDDDEDASDENDENDSDEDEDDDDDDDDHDEDDDSGNHENSKNDRKDDKNSEKKIAEKSPARIVKDPNSRRYFYVERR